MAMDRAMDLGRYHCRRTLAARAGALRVGVTSVTAVGACVETDAATIEPDTALSTGAARASVLLTHPQHRQPPANARKSDALPYSPQWASARFGLVRHAPCALEPTDSSP